MICVSKKEFTVIYFAYTTIYSSTLFSSFFASYDAMNEYCGDRNVYQKLSTVDGNDT